MTSSHLLISNLTKDWIETMERWQLQLFWIPAVIITFAIFIANPILLVCIFMSPALRRETRYLLVANTLVADIIFLILNLVTLIGNAVRAEIPWFVCQLSTALLVTASSCAIITVTLMVIDTFTAVRWPLQYHNLLSPARTSSILGVVWLLCAIYPFTLMMTMMKDEIPNNKVTMCLTLLSFGFFKVKNMGDIEMYFFVAGVICTFLIFYCYIRLYMVTRTQGIWHSRFSRARVTVLVHGVLLLLYFAPGLVFALEIYIFQEKNMSQDLRVWISTVNANVFMLLPRAFAPCLYGLRYREIYQSLALLLHRHRRSRESTVS
ncbi:PREDICTED: probable G-protein coupled receptor 148 [Poecilia mexicana]|uniref:G-protein coupled receptors family 1 profile domain-containing protein n=1 Tax=Poecilia mexicana TaxID=48701 RepID=A0A3B3X3Y9_9TELE|nr:PREDICTED: probable G-protein coupled receptor 148 [Poecilia mexicana]